jgi:hypothetical protein
MRWRQPNRRVPEQMENHFIPLTWQEKRMLNFWMNCEPDTPKDNKVIRGQFNLDLYLKYRKTIQN